MNTFSLYKKICFLFITIIFGAISVQAQNFEQRVNFGALLEPESGVIHGAGQSSNAFESYWEVMDEGEKPMVYMFYIGLSSVNENWYVPLKQELLERKDVLIIPQIGLSMTTDGSPDQHYEDDVANGDYDEQIAHLISGFKKLGTPAYLRIGYEFNGVTWNGYVPETYKQAFQKISAEISAANVEVATVWCAAMDGARNFFDYYPGDEYVDWFGIDIFSQSHFADPDAQKFLDSASARQKPVMLGETTPRGVGTKNGQASWDGWFDDYFTFIKENPEIKLTSYINWNWAEYPQWSDWGDARIEDSGIVKDLYTGEKDSAAYIHAQSESSFRSMLGYVDDQVPAPVTNFKNIGAENEAILSWNPTTDASGIARYRIFRNDELIDFTSDTVYSDRSLKPSETYTYEVVAVDRSGDESAPSSSVIVETSDTIQKIQNGEFNDSTSWELATFEDAEAEFSIVDDANISGENSGAVKVTSSTGTDWNIQLRQSMNIVAGSKYEISFKAKASSEVSFITVLQQVNAPYVIYKQIQTNLTAETQTFKETFTASVSDFVFLSFFVGDIGTAEVWVDSVSILEEQGPKNEEGEKILNGSFDDGTGNWSFDLFNEGASATFGVDDIGVYEDQANGGFVDITSTTGTDWHIQLRQFFEIKKGYAYDVTFDALASQTISMNLYLQENREPYSFYSQETFELSTNPESYSVTFEPEINDVPAFTFFLGDLGEVQVLFDNVSVKERSLTVSNEEEVENPNEIKLYLAYPNPFNPSTNLSFNLPEASFVKLLVYDMLGRKVQTLAEGVRPSGLNSFQLNASNLSSGIYIVRLVSGNTVQNQKITLLK